MSMQHSVKPAAITPGTLSHLEAHAVLTSAVDSKHNPNSLVISQSKLVEMLGDNWEEKLDDSRFERKIDDLLTPTGRWIEGLDDPQNKELLTKALGADWRQRLDEERHERRLTQSSFSPQEGGEIFWCIDKAKLTAVAHCPVTAAEMTGLLERRFRGPEKARNELNAAKEKKERLHEDKPIRLPERLVAEELGPAWAARMEKSGLTFKPVAPQDASQDEPQIHIDILPLHKLTAKALMDNALRRLADAKYHRV